MFLMKSVAQSDAEVTTEFSCWRGVFLHNPVLKENYERKTFVKGFPIRSIDIRWETVFINQVSILFQLSYQRIAYYQKPIIRLSS